jgi:hypothetical protein
MKNITELLKEFQDLENVEKGGFFPLPQSNKCNSSEHEPPKYLYIPPGQGYRHVCPACGKVSVIIPPQITF